jgi:hypothetical protein
MKKKNYKKLSTEKSVTGWKVSPFTWDFYKANNVTYANVYCAPLHVSECKKVLSSLNPLTPLKLSLTLTDKTDIALLPKSSYVNFKHYKDFNGEASLMLITSDKFSKLHDFSDIKLYKDVKIKISDLSTNDILKAVMRSYPKEITDNITEISDTVDNPAIYAMITSHPNNEINKLLRMYNSMGTGMHLISISKIMRDDNFFIKNEKYEKSSFDMFKCMKYYPGLTKLQDRSIYYNTLSVKYAFYINKKFQFEL